MKANEAVTDVVKDIEKRFPDAQMELVEVSQALLDDVVVEMKKWRFIEENMFLYDDEENPLRNTWVDVEGEGYGWVWNTVEDSPEAWHHLMVERVMDYVTKRSLEGQALVIREADSVTYRFFNRENWRDISFTFSDHKPFFGAILDAEEEEDGLLFQELATSIEQANAYAEGDASHVTIRTVTIEDKKES